MTLQLDNAALALRFDQGVGAVELAREFGTSYQVISYRLRQMGRVSRGRKRSDVIGPRHIRALRDNLGLLLDLKEFLSKQREDLISRMGEDPGPKTLDRLGKLTDFIQGLHDITLSHP